MSFSSDTGGSNKSAIHLELSAPFGSDVSGKASFGISKCSVVLKKLKVKKVFKSCHKRNLVKRRPRDVIQYYRPTTDELDCSNRYSIQSSESDVFWDFIFQKDEESQSKRTVTKSLLSMRSNSPGEKLEDKMINFLAVINKSNPQPSNSKRKLLSPDPPNSKLSSPKQNKVTGGLTTSPKEVSEPKSSENVKNKAKNLDMSTNLKQKDKRKEDSKAKLIEDLFNPDPANSKSSLFKQAKVSSGLKNCQEKGKNTSKNMGTSPRLKPRDSRREDSMDQLIDQLFNPDLINSKSSSVQQTRASPGLKSCRKEDSELESSKTAKNTNMKQNDKRKEDSKSTIKQTKNSLVSKSCQKKDSESKVSEKTKNMDIDFEQKAKRRKLNQIKEGKKVIDELENSKTSTSEIDGNNLEELEESDQNMEAVNIAKTNDSGDKKQKQKDHSNLSIVNSKTSHQLLSHASDDTQSKSFSPQLPFDELKSVALASGAEIMNTKCYGFVEERSKDGGPVAIESSEVVIRENGSLDYADIFGNIDEADHHLDVPSDDDSTNMNDIHKLDGSRLSLEAAPHLIWLRQNRICFRLIELGQCGKKENGKCGLDHKRSFEAVMNYFELIKKSSPEQLPLYLKKRDSDHDQIKRMMSIYIHNSIPKGKQANGLDPGEKDEFFILAQNALIVAMMAEKSKEIQYYFSIIINDIQKVLSDQLRDESIFFRLRNMTSCFVFELAKMSNLEFPEEKRDIYCKKVYAMILIAFQNGINLDRYVYEEAAELFRKQKEAIYSCQIIKYSRFTPGFNIKIQCIVNSYMVFISKLDIHEFEDIIAPVLISLTATELQELQDDLLTKKFLIKVMSHCEKMLKKEGVNKVGLIKNVLFRLQGLNLVDPKIFDQIFQEPVPLERDEGLIQVEEMLKAEKFMQMREIYNQYLFGCLDQPYQINKIYNSVFKTICDKEGQEFELWERFIQTLTNEVCPTPIERMFMCQLGSSLAIYLADKKRYQDVTNLSHNIMGIPFFQELSFWNYGYLVSEEGIRTENSSLVSRRHVFYQILLSCVKTGKPEMGYFICLKYFPSDESFIREPQMNDLLSSLINAFCEKKNFDEAMGLFYNYIRPVMRDFSNSHETFFPILVGQLEREESRSNLTEKIIPFVHECLPEVRVIPDVMNHRDTLRMLVNYLGVKDSKGVKDNMTAYILMISTCQLCIEHDIYPSREDRILPIYHDCTQGEIRGVLMHFFADLCNNESVIRLRDKIKAGKSTKELEAAGLDDFKVTIHMRMNIFESKIRLSEVSIVMRVKQTLESFEPKIYFNDGIIEERSLIFFLASEIEKGSEKCTG